MPWTSSLRDAAARGRGPGPGSACWRYSVVWGSGLSSGEGGAPLGGEPWFRGGEHSTEPDSGA